MKTLALLFLDRSDIGLVHFIGNSLEDIFQGHVQIRPYFLAELAPAEPIVADAYLLEDRKLYRLAKHHIADLTRALILRRTVNIHQLDPVKAIPPGTDVLVANDSYQGSLETAYSLYERGIGHLSLFPLDPTGERPPLSRQGNCRIAITPGEKKSVPEGMDQVIDIGPREVESVTIISLMNLLSINYDDVNQSLVRFIRKTSDMNAWFHRLYFSWFLRTQAMNHLFETSKEAVYVLDQNRDPIYRSLPAEQLGLSDDTIRSLPTGSYEVREVSLEDASYAVHQMPINVLSETIGYALRIQRLQQGEDPSVNHAAEAQRLPQTKEIEAGRDASSLCARYTFADIIYSSQAMARCVSIAKTVAPTEHTVLITGESGTGKELFAQSIHNYSARNRAPFVAINCAALPDSLLQSELFGYEKGAFTGANRTGKIGLFEQAAGGTIFLDEIGDISPKMQLTLLRVLQERQIMRIGGNSLVSIHCRIIAATNQDLKASVENGTFRKDLFYRLNVITIHVPPLSQRKDDILPLLKRFMPEEKVSFTRSDKDILLKYNWPGNVRELESVATFYSTFACLPDEMQKVQIAQPPTKAADPVPRAFDQERIQRELLQVIYGGTQMSHGIGRNAISQKLKERGIHIGDKNLRALLSQMESDDLISIGKGRVGCQITSHGYQVMKIMGPITKGHRVAGG